MFGTNCFSCCSRKLMLIKNELVLLDNGARGTAILFLSQMIFVKSLSQVIMSNSLPLQSDLNPRQCEKRKFVAQKIRDLRINTPKNGLHSLDTAKNGNISNK